MLQAPAGTPAGTTAEVTIEAQSDQAPFPTARATARVQVGAQVSGELGGACETNALPGAIVPCAHTIANTGLSDATFALTTTSSLGWENTIAPPSLFVKAGATATFTVTVKVPSSADAGALQKLTVSARSSGGAEVAGKVVDAITVLRVTGVSIAPGQTRKPVAKQQVRFVHTLINTGNAPDSFTISATQQRDWGIAISPMQTPILPRGASYSITVLVQAPADMPATAINQIVVRATSDADPRTYDQLVDLLTPDAAGSPETVWFYQPVVAR